jgi:PHD/YefM family antitoxin component YafN of YafNO toxin-antitoxin module
VKKEVPIMPDMTNAITNTISISLFNRGLAGKVFEDVKRSGAKVVIKNNVPECVLMSPDEYVRLMDEINDARLLALATERMSNYDASRVISEAEVLKELGITADDLADADKVEIE